MRHMRFTYTLLRQALWYENRGSHICIVTRLSAAFCKRFTTIHDLLTWCRCVDYNFHVLNIKTSPLHLTNETLYYFSYFPSYCIWAAPWQKQQNDLCAQQRIDQPGHPPSLISVFAVRMKKHWVLSYPLSAREDSDQTERMPRLI